MQVMKNEFERRDANATRIVIGSITTAMSIIVVAIMYAALSNQMQRISTLPAIKVSAPEVPIAISDVVQLLSGGPLMTVVFVENDGVVNAVWFDLESRFHEGSFPAFVLAKKTF